jgi:hypothetical protein
MNCRTVSVDAGFTGTVGIVGVLGRRAVPDGRHHGGIGQGPSGGHSSAKKPMAAPAIHNPTSARRTIPQDFEALFMTNALPFEDCVLDSVSDIRNHM